MDGVGTSDADGTGATETDGTGPSPAPANRYRSSARRHIGRVVRWVGTALAIWLVVQMVVTATVAVALMIDPGTTTWQDCQPETVTYDDGSYCAAVHQRREPRWFVVPVIEERQEIWVGRGHQPSYGHVVEHELAGDIDLLVADWTPDGLTLVEPSGHRVFVPAESFMGGR